MVFTLNFSVFNYSKRKQIILLNNRKISTKGAFVCHSNCLKGEIMVLHHSVVSMNFYFSLYDGI